ncbi:hypothetical protein Pla110_29080 [Polystyrenella longa]|uniref:Lipoprotein n=1 Tax=Polystyrenella longa TaxID=2528007 RepID=A0A518CPM1_9PLAN|nr:hypothetical protein [Polystyrenella longa]QDU81170.1 hypothetical protein Pla110_29080 [Polystyrenella longa]
MRWICVCLLVCLLASSGCMHRGRDKVVYMRPEYNALNRLSFNIDKYSHQPPRARHVDYYRWMYNKGPIDRTLLPELYTHQPITSDTLMPVVAESGETEPTQTINAEPWQWSQSTPGQPAVQLERISMPDQNNGIQLLSGQAVHPTSTTAPTAQQRPTMRPTVRQQRRPPNQWMFSPVVNH